MTHLFQSDESRFVGFCQPCWRDDSGEHRSPMSVLTQFIVRGVLATQTGALEWIISTVRKVSSEIDHRAGGEGCANETEVLISPLGTACSDAEHCSVNKK
jgi:hypothetical protein